MLSIVLALALSFIAPKAHELRIKVHTSEHARVVMVVVENEDYYRASTFEVEPDKTTYWVDFRDVPSGVYQLEGVERLDTGKDQVAAQVTVMVP